MCSRGNSTINRNSVIEISIPLLSNSALFKFRSMGQFSIVLGSRVRLRNGCQGCKKSKKKCDEQLPLCSLCLKRGITCTYVNFRPGRIEKTRRQSKANDSTIAKYAAIDQGIIIELNKKIRDDTFDGYMESVPTSDFNLHLDDIGLLFLLYFEDNVSTHLCIDTNTSNYLAKTFLQMSLTEEAIANALACWGGVFKEYDGLNNSLVRRHYNKSIGLIEKLEIKESFHYYIILCFYQIIIGIKVCTGDVNHWYLVFEACSRLINSKDLLGHLLHKFDYSNDIKWLISNFQYHDILNTRSFMRGTIIDLPSFDLTTPDYGIDPFQGCNHEIIAVLGEIINQKIITDFANMTEVQDKYESLSNKLTNTRPLIIQSSKLLEADYAKYMSLFKVFKITVECVLLMYFKLLPPAALDIQLLVSKGLKEVNELSTSLFSCLTFPFLIFGINTIGSKKLGYLDVINKTSSVYKVGNLLRVKHLVMIFWERSQNGAVHVDWLDVVRELNWELCLC